MDGYCRACLNNFDDPDLLQYSEEKRRLFVYSTGLQVKRNDVFTFQLCKECYFSMKASCRFKKMCRTSDKKIKNYLTLKDVDDGMDLNSFLKANEESSIFRLPILSGASTPARHKMKDDDNESTCTSIQNFMTDILRADEIPDSEARIIREVIEEEADVLEDSLDSHWLEEDPENDEFRLDLSLSRFSTPRSTNQDRMTSPDQRELTSTDITSGEDYDNIPVDIGLKKLSNPVDNCYVLHNTHITNVKKGTKKTECVIDKNLEKALRDENNQEISLQELLASPVYPSKSGASTPTIKQIIFGDKNKNSKKSKSPKFETDLDFFIGKLDNNIKSQNKFQRGKIELAIGTGKGNKYELSVKKAMKSEKENIDLDKPMEGKKIDLGKFTAGKCLQEKLDLSKGKLNEENKLCNEQLGKLYQDNFNFENFVVEKLEEARPTVDNLNVEYPQDDKLDLNIEALLEDNNQNMVPGNVNNIENLQIEMFREPAGAEFMEEDSDDGILEEFLNVENEKLAYSEMKRKAVYSLANAARMNDAELTVLLQEAYDHNFLGFHRGKKVQSPVVQSPKKGVKLTKKLDSPVENKYCITNFYCKMCEMKFESLKALKIHFAKRHQYKINTPKKTWKLKVKMCDLCGKTFTNSKSLVKHLENHNKPTVYTCDKCSLTFKTKNGFNSHKVTHMITKGQKLNTKQNELDSKYICKICGAISSSSSNHILHERRHSKSYTLHCKDCGKGFYRTTELVTHRRQHTGEKPYPCTHCYQSFSRRDTLNKHMKCHAGAKKYACLYCNRMFSKSYDVKIHHSTDCLKFRED